MISIHDVKNDRKYLLYIDSKEEFEIIEKFLGTNIFRNSAGYKGKHLYRLAISDYSSTSCKNDDGSYNYGGYNYGAYSNYYIVCTINDLIEYNIKEKTNMQDIYSILKGIYENNELRKTVVPLFMGNPGIGKTIQIKQFAKDKGVKLVSFITSQRNPFEISGLAYPDKDLKRMSFWDFDTLLDMKDGDILFFDEILNGNPNVLNACLTLIEEREMISGKKLPNIMIVAAANPQGQCIMTPQMKERFVWYDIKWDSTGWKKIMQEKYSLPNEILNKLVAVIKSETFTTNNFLTPRSIDKNVNMILNDVYTPYETDLLPILNSMIKNNSETLLKIGDKIIGKDELFNWLESSKYFKQLNK